MRSLSFLLVLALPPLMVLASGLGSTPAPFPAGFASGWGILLVEAVLVAGYALARRERRRLDDEATSPATPAARRAKRSARNLLPGH